jgi:hypothetical protein
LRTRRDLCGHTGVDYRFGSHTAISRPWRADVAQLVAHHLAKVRVAGSNPVIRSKVQSHQPLRWSGRVVRQRPAKPCTRVRFPSPPLLKVSAGVGKCQFVRVKPQAKHQNKRWCRRRMTTAYAWCFVCILSRPGREPANIPEAYAFALCTLVPGGVQTTGRQPFDGMTVPSARLHVGVNPAFGVKEVPEPGAYSLPAADRQAAPDSGAHPSGLLPDPART